MKKIPTSSEVNAYAEALLKKRERKILFRRVTALTMVVVMLATALFLVRPSEALTEGASAAAGNYTEGVEREADPSTMDTYREILDFTDNTRYAGKLWTDKSVFAYGQNSVTTNASDPRRTFKDNKLQLSEGLDGATGEVGLDSDFLEVYSALGSSVAVNQYPLNPIDLVIVIDMSGSMAQSTKWPVGLDGEEYNSGKGETMEERIKNSRIQKTLDAVNQSIDTIMAQNPNNRVSVVGYGGSAAVILPLAHWKRIDENTPYLTVGGMETLRHLSDLKYEFTGDPKIWNRGWVWRINHDACYTVVANANYNLNDKKDNGDGYKFTDDDKKYGEVGDISGEYKKTVSNNVKNDNVKALPGYETWKDGKAPAPAFGANKDPDRYYPYVNYHELKADEYIGYYTNTQGGIYLGYSQLAQNKETIYTETLTNNETVTVPRIPAAIIMTDGGANFALNEMGKWGERFGKYAKDAYGNPIVDGNHVQFEGDRSSSDTIDQSHRLYNGASYSNTGDEWYKVYLPGIKEGDTNSLTSLYNDGEAFGNGDLLRGPNWGDAGVLYSSDNDVFGTSGTCLQVLLTASYMKTTALKNYEAGWDSRSIPTEDRRDLQTYTVSVDSKDVPQWGRLRLYPTMDPANYFVKDGEWWNDVTLFDDDSTIPQGYTKAKIFGGMLASWKQWKSGESTNANMDSHQVKIKISPLPDDGYTDTNFGDVKITNQDVIDNIVYTNGFYDVDSTDVEGIFGRIVSKITTPLFAPVAGSNDLGVDDSVTFLDPVGKYMEVKDVKNLLLFGKLYDIKKAAVYDYQFNYDYMKNHPDNTNDNFLKEGWYKGENGATADYGGAGAAPEGGTAWEDGWVYRVNAKTASAYVPSLGDVVNVPESDQGLDSKLRHTEYTFYRVEAADVDALKMNPAYLSDDTDSGGGENSGGNGNGESPGGNVDQTYTENDAGVYRLNDFRVWVEDTENYVDETVEEGGLETDIGYDEALCVNIPRNMLPLRTVTVTEEKAGEWTYKSNLDEGSKGHSASFPLRVFYTVGVEESILTADNRIALGGISAEYIKNNKVATDVAANARGREVGDLEFFSNWYNPENRYSAYVTVNGSYSYGDPASTYSPSGDNRYYIFQKSLPLYKAAYRYDGSNWEEVKINEASTDPMLTPTGFGGTIVGINLEGDSSSIGTAVPDAKKGDIVLLKNDRLTDVKVTDNTDPFPSENYYFLPTDHFKLNTDTDTNTKDAQYTQYCVARKGSEFGSAYHSSGITNGDMLCWYDASGKNKTIYPYHSYTETNDASRGRDYIGLEPSEYTKEDGTFKKLDEFDEGLNQKHEDVLGSGDNWVVATRPGGLRAGNLAESIGEKTRGYKTWPVGKDDEVYLEILDGEGYSYDDENDDVNPKSAYKNERFPDKAGDDNFTIEYYNGNVTRTSNSYYLPTISKSSVSAESDIIVNSYLGNNGRLVVADTTFYMTKTVTPPAEGMPVNENKEFNYQVFIDGKTGDYDAIVVKYENGSWKRQFHYIDLKLDEKYFLLSTDDSKVMTDDEGNRVIQKDVDDSGNPIYVYAADSEDGSIKAGMEYTKGTIYYVFLGTNTNADGAETGASGNVMRLYHNMEVHSGETGFGDVDRSAVIEGGDGDVKTFTAAKVYLFTEEQYSAFTDDGNGNYQDADGAPHDINNDSTKQYKSVSDYWLLTLNTNVSDKTVYADTESAIDSPFLSQSEYWTKTVTFGVNSNDDGDSKQTDNQTLTVADLYSDAEFLGVDKASIPAHTAEVALKHGYGLLFAGIDVSTKYRVTEQITEKDKEEDYAFRSVEHKTGNTVDTQWKYTVDSNGNPQSDPKGNTANFGKNAKGLNYYSVFNNTDNYEQAAHYVNTYGLDALEIVKHLELEDKTDYLYDKDNGIKFEFTVTFTLPEWYSGTLGDLHIWTGPEGNVFEAPPADNTDWTNWTSGNGVGTIRPPDLVADSDGRTYTVTFTLTAEQAYIIYGLPIGTKYTVTETRNSEYPIENDNGVQDGLYTHSGEIKNSDLDENNSFNTETFTNVKPAPVYGELTVEKVAKNGKEGDEFTFTVTLDVPSNDILNYTYRPNEVTIVRVFGADGKEVRMQRGVFDELGEQTPDSSGLRHYSGEITIKGGQKFTIEGIPLGSTYTVTEESDPNYKLEGVGKSEDGVNFSDAGAIDGKVSGTIEKAGENLYYYKYTNTRYFVLPDVGGYSPWIRLLGALLLLVSSCVLAGSAIKKNKKR